MRQRVQCYVFGLLGWIERKNSWQLAEGKGETGPQGVQRLLNGAIWDADGARDGAATHEWVCLPLSESCAKAKRRWLLVRRRPADPSDLAYYLVYGPQETPLPELVRVCDRRWAIEEGFAEAKGEVGLDHYEVRTWTAWHRFITLGLLAHATLVVLRQRAFAA